MSAISEILEAEDVALELRATTLRAAISETAERLRDHVGVLDWEALAEGLYKAAPCLAVSADFSICVSHTRTDGLSSLVMSVGRSEKGISFPGCEAPVRYLFCIGVQQALEADYPRLVGLLARIVKDPDSEQELRTATSGTEFVEALARFEAKL